MGVRLVRQSGWEILVWNHLRMYNCVCTNKPMYSWISWISHFSEYLIQNMFSLGLTRKFKKILKIFEKSSNFAKKNCIKWAIFKTINFPKILWLYEFSAKIIRLQKFWTIYALRGRRYWKMSDLFEQFFRLKLNMRIFSGYKIAYLVFWVIQ